MYWRVHLEAKKFYVDLASFPVTAGDAVFWKSEKHVSSQYMTFPIRWCSRTDLFGISFFSRRTLINTTERKSPLQAEVRWPFRKMRKCYYSCFFFCRIGKGKSPDSNRSKSWMRRVTWDTVCVTCCCHCYWKGEHPGKQLTEVMRVWPSSSGKEPEKGGTSRSKEGRKHLQGDRITDL